MGYRIYIKKNCKAVVYRVPDWWGDGRLDPRLLGIGIVMSAGFAVPMIAPDSGVAYTPPVEVTRQETAPRATMPGVFAESLDTPARLEEILSASLPERIPETPWTRVKVANGDNLSIIFSRLGFTATTLDAVLASSDAALLLNQLHPGQTLQFQVAGDELIALRFEPNVRDSLKIERSGDGYVGSLITTELDRRVRQSGAEIASSLFTAGQEAGLSDGLIMDLVAIFGWDIDFALDIWEGDRFRVVYEEYSKDGAKVADGPILAAEFSNRGRLYRAVRYTSADGQTGYFSESGASMRKAFLRTPLNFTRISSGFNLQRRHPILNRIRAHRGVDYAAPPGTPIRATGYGVVAFAGNKGGYGNTLIVRHGGTYDTLYAHMSRFARGIRKGTRVNQGDIIGYVGLTGLATGPHLHYEFQVNGVHRNPLTISLPRAEGIPADQIAKFETETAPLLARLGEPARPEDSMIVQKEDTAGVPAVP